MKIHRAEPTSTVHERLVRVGCAGALAAVISVAVSACGGSGSSGGSGAPGGAASIPNPGGAVTAAPSPGNPPSSTPSNSAAPPSASGAVAASGDFPCSLFSLAQIKAATGYDVVAAKPITAVADPSQHSCEWADAKGHSFGIIAAPHNGRHALQIFSQVQNTGSAISGFGDAAWGNKSEIGVVFGDAYVEVSDDSDANDDNATLADIGIDRLKEMATTVHNAMG